MKKTTDILAHVPTDLRAKVEHCANQFGAVQTIFGIPALRQPTLLQHADTHALRWRWRVVRVEELDAEERLLNLATRLVVAVRIESAAKQTRTSCAQSSRKRH